MGRPEGELAEGPLSRAATVAYWFLVIEVLLVLSTAPGLVAALFLDRAVGNLPLLALCAVPLGPAVAAALFAWRVFLRERDTSPAHHFWRGYRLNLLDALRVWVPALAVLVVLATNVAFADVAAARSGAGIPVAVFVGLAAFVVLCSVRMLAITSAFAFRWRDAARITAFTLTARPLVSLGLVSLLVLTAGITVLTSDAVTVLLGSVLTFLVARNEAPVLALVHERFVDHATEPGGGGGAGPEVDRPAG